MEKEMKITFRGNGVVWDKTRNRRLCKFEKGIYETDNAHDIEVLRDYPTYPENAVNEYYAEKAKEKKEADKKKKAADKKKADAAKKKETKPKKEG